MLTYMSRLRLLLAWLVMAALPLQGFAAASMLFCGMEQTARVSEAGDRHDSHRHSDAASSASAHDHAAHGHASKADSGSGKTAKSGQDKQGHACPVCASCCQVVAVGGFEAFPQTSAPPGAGPTAPIFRVQTRTATVPDRPPRV
jgi:hypothetical protein